MKRAEQWEEALSSPAPPCTSPFRCTRSPEIANPLKLGGPPDLSAVGPFIRPPPSLPICGWCTVPGGTIRRGLHVWTPQHSTGTGHPPRGESTAPRPPPPSQQDAGLGRLHATASGLATPGPEHGEREEAALWWPLIPQGEPNQTKPTPQPPCPRPPHFKGERWWQIPQFWVAGWAPKTPTEKPPETDEMQTATIPQRLGSVVVCARAYSNASPSWPSAMRWPRQCCCTTVHTLLHPSVTRPGPIAMRDTPTQQPHPTA